MKLAHLERDVFVEDSALTQQALVSSRVRIPTSKKISSGHRRTLTLLGEHSQGPFNSSSSPPLKRHSTVITHSARLSRFVCLEMIAVIHVNPCDQDPNAALQRCLDGEPYLSIPTHAYVGALHSFLSHA